MSEDPTNSQPYSELQKVLKSFVSSNTNTNTKKEVGGSCVKEAEAAAVKARDQHESMIIQQNTASGEAGESTAPSTPSEPSIATADQTTAADKGGEDLLNDAAPMPQTLDEATDHINKLKTMRDSLLEEKSRNDKFVSRYQEKVAKSERMATLHHLIPRELFVREDRYQQELEHVYKWSGITDQEIAEIYQRKLGNINSNTKFKPHGASSVMPNNKDPYQNFRDVPDFSKVNGKPLSSSSTNDLKRNLEFMKKIVGGGNGGIN